LSTTLLASQPDGKGEPSRSRLIDVGLAAPYNEEITSRTYAIRWQVRRP